VALGRVATSDRVLAGHVVVSEDVGLWEEPTA